jgi:aryl-alcohol dehydrogenase-like predicted oxidoreductase
MTDWLRERIKLGRTELMSGRLGLGASYGTPTEAIEAAFEAGCNYFYWGALRNKKMTRAIQNIIAQGKRDDLIIVIQAFKRSRRGLEKSLMRGLKALGADCADVLLLGWYNKAPKQKLFDEAENLKKQGAFKYLGLSTHKRSLIPLLAKDSRFDLFQIRYNAANRGAEEDIFPLLPEERPGIVAFQTTRRMSLVNSSKIPSGEKRPTAGDCYRFALSNPYVDVVTSAPSTTAQMEENLSVVARGPMAEEELAWMRRIGDHVYGRAKK